MRPIQLALAAATAAALAAVLAAGSAQASPLNALRGSQLAVDGIQVTQNVQQYCFHTDGWKGAGFYRCGFHNRRGLGWHGARDSREHTRRESRRGTR
jgi:hypothetical protein